ISPAAYVPPVPFLAFPGKTNQKSLRPAEFPRLERQGVVAPIFIAEKTQPGGAIALSIGAIHNRPISSIGFPSVRILGKIRFVKHLPCLLDPNILVFGGSFPGADADAPVDRLWRWRIEHHIGAESVCRPILCKKLPQIVRDRPKTAG